MTKHFFLIAVEWMDTKIGINGWRRCFMVAGMEQRVAVELEKESILTWINTLGTLFGNHCVRNLWFLYSIFYNWNFTAHGCADVFCWTWEQFHCSIATWSSGWSMSMFFINSYKGKGQVRLSKSQWSFRYLKNKQNSQIIESSCNLWRPASFIQPHVYYG